MKRILLIILLIVSVGFINSCGVEQNYQHKEIKYIDTGINPNEWVFVKAGKVFTGQFYEEEEIDYDFEIMKTPVTNEQYVNYLNKALRDGKIKIENNTVMGFYKGDEFSGFRHELKIEKGFHPYVYLDKAGIRFVYKNNEFVVDKGFENHPVVLITWFGANGYAEYFGYRLPLEIEWERAARGDKKISYPWGEFLDESYANFNFSNHNIMRLLNYKHPITSPVGFFNGKDYDGYKTNDAKSFFGLYDMAGNVWEWIGDKYERMSDRFMKGGSFRNYDNNLRVWTRNSARPDYSGIDVGFRCVRDVKKDINQESVSEINKSENNENNGNEK